MEGRDVSALNDSNQHNSHTYHGLGCATIDGSTTSCSLSTSQTRDNETQAIGSYYNFSAATSGSGPNTADAGVNVADTFCPLGWQLPSAGTGGDYYNQSKSFGYLLKAYGFDYSAADEDDQSTSNAVRSYPFSLLYAGRSAYGMLYDTGVIGRYWLGTKYEGGSGRRLGIWYNVITNDSNNSTWLFPIRWNVANKKTAPHGAV